MTNGREGKTSNRVCAVCVKCFVFLTCNLLKVGNKSKIALHCSDCSTYCRFDLPERDLLVFSLTKVSFCHLTCCIFTIKMEVEIIESGIKMSKGGDAQGMFCCPPTIQ